MAGLIAKLLEHERRWRWIRKEARVDPTAFPEDEFPIYCLDCGYCLTGVESGACPECGRAFERGRLLVQIYVSRKLCFAGPGHGTMRRTIRTVTGVGIALASAFAVLGYVTDYWPGWLEQVVQISSEKLNTIVALSSLAVIVMYYGFAFFMMIRAQCIVRRHGVVGSPAKRRRMLEALRRSDADR